MQARSKSTSASFSELKERERHWQWKKVTLYSKDNRKSKLSASCNSTRDEIALPRPRAQDSLDVRVHDVDHRRPQLLGHFQLMPFLGDEKSHQRTRPHRSLLSPMILDA